MEHTYHGKLVDCGQVGFDTFWTCTTCGVSRTVDGTYTLFFPARGRFSTDCALAQEQVRFYLWGRLDALRDSLAGATDYLAEKRLEATGLVVGALGAGQSSLPRIAKALFLLIEEQESAWPEDIAGVLAGGRAAPEGPPLEIEL